MVENKDKEGLTAEFHGHLGNHMYQYAYTRLLAEKENKPFKLKSPLIKKVFNAEEESSRTAVFYNYAKNGYPHYQGPTELNLILENRNKVQDWFKPSDFGKSILKERNFPAVINVRGLEFIQLNWAINPQYYYKIIEQLKSKPIIVTDDMEYSKKTFGNLEIFHTVDDYSILYHAKKLVCSNSTYCWWAAFLGEHDLVVSPDQNWVDALNYKRSDLFRYSFRPFFWGIEKLHWARLGPHGLVR